MIGYYILVFIIAVALGAIGAKLYLEKKKSSGKPGTGLKAYVDTSAPAVITKDTKIGELLAMNPDYAKILTAQGMHCVGCPSSQNETLEEAAAVHKMNLQVLLKKLNR